MVIYQLTRYEILENVKIQYTDWLGEYDEYVDRT